MDKKDLEIPSVSVEDLLRFLKEVEVQHKKRKRKNKIKQLFSF